MYTVSLMEEACKDVSNLTGLIMIAFRIHELEVHRFGLKPANLRSCQSLGES